MAFKDRDFFKDAFTRDEIIGLLQGKPAAEMFNFRSPSFKQLGKKPEDLADKDLIDLMLREPRFVRRPVVRIDGQVYFSADAKKLQELLG